MNIQLLINKYSLSPKNLKPHALLIVLMLGLSACSGGSGSEDASPGTNTTGTGSTNTWLVPDYTSTGVTGTFGSSVMRTGQDMLLTYAETSSKNLLKTQDGSAFTEYTPPEDAQLVFIDEAGLMYFGGFNSAYANDYALYTSFDAINFTTVGVTSRFGLPSLVNGNSSRLIGIRFGSGKVELSTDNAITWTQIDLNSDTLFNSEDVVVDNLVPAYNGINTFVLLSSTGGLLVSSDAGTTWNKALETEGVFSAVSGNSQFPNKFYAAKMGKVFESTDFGINWAEVTSPLLNGQPIVEFLKLVLLDDGTLLVWGLANNAGQDKGQVFKSIDSGISWNTIGDPIGVSTSTFAPGSGYVDLTANDSHYFTRSLTTIYTMPR